ncbi:TPA: adhesin biosynthesis transcription regulatory family protein [Escherichia coli]
MRKGYDYQPGRFRGGVPPGTMPENQFWLLAEISPLHSEKVIHALRDYLVDGYTRAEVCERYGVSQGYFSVSLKRFHNVHQTVYRLLPFYRSAGGCGIHE